MAQQANDSSLGSILRNRVIERKNSESYLLTCTRTLTNAHKHTENKNNKQNVTYISLKIRCVN